jgi:hypothetical protein
MRELTSTITAEVQERFATEPIIIIKVEWPDSTTLYYSDKDVTVGAITAAGLITQFSPIASAGKIRGTGDYSSASVSLFDELGNFKTLMDKYTLAGATVTVYQHYVGTLQADLVVLLQGLLKKPVWSEGARLLTFEVEVIFEAQEVGYVAEVDAFTDFNNDVEGSAWPLCFGTVLEVPCLKIQKYGVKAKTTQDFDNGQSDCYIENKIENGSFVFPVDTSIELNIGGILCTGTFSDADVTIGSGFEAKTWTLPVFNVSTYNAAHFSNISLGERDQYDGDRDNAAVLWIDSDDDLVGQYCIINHSEGGWLVNYCERQLGRKCFFRQVWAGNGYSEFIIDETETIYEAAPVVRSSWAATYVAGVNDYTTRRDGTLVSEKWQIEEYRENGEVVKGKFKILKGAEVIYETPGVTDLYLVNMIESSEIVDVWAYRNYGNERIYVPVPSSYYTKHLAYSINGMTVTAIEFTDPLSTRPKEQWEDELFVSVRSSVAPNAATIIKYIIENYTTLSIDSDTFDEVALLVQDFWMCFCLTTVTDAIKLIEDLAWQARCALINDSGTIKMKFLPLEPNADLTIDESWVGTQTLELGTTDLDDVRTVLRGNWLKTYSGEDRTLVYRNNESTYGTVEEELTISAFNMEYCVDACLDFWGYRLSNIWRQVTLRTFMNALSAQPYDCIASGIDEVSINTIKGIANSLSHDNLSDFIDTSLELASKPTDIDAYGNPEQDDDYWPGNPTTPDVKDPAAGRDEIDYIPPIPEEPNSSDGGGTGGGGGGGGNVNNIFLKFSGMPSDITRGTNFGFTLRATRYDGTTFNTNRSFALQLQSSDGSDVLNTVTGFFNGGVFTTTTAQITAGAGVDSGHIVAAASGADAASSNSFNITDAKGTLTWVVPSTITRDTDFAASISGGSAGLVLGVSLTSEDPQDTLYDNTGQPVTSITLDGSGNFSVADWQIRGGQGADFGTVTAEDTSLAYDNAVSSIFTISGLSTARVENQTVSFSDEFQAMEEDLVLTATTDINTYSPFGLSVSYEDDEGTPLDYDGVAYLKAYNITDGSYVDWSDIGPNAVNYGDHAVITLEDGAWAYTDCNLDWTDYWDETLRIEVYIVRPDGSTIADIIDVDLAHADFVLDMPISVIRGTPFTLTITVMNGDGTPNETYVPPATLPLTLANPGSDILTPSTIPTTGWANGKYTTSVTLSGGSGIVNHLLQLEDVTNDLTGTVLFEVGKTTVVRTRSRWGNIFGQYSTGDLTGTPDAPNAASYWADVDFNTKLLYDADYVAAGGGAGSAEYYLQDEYTYVAMAGLMYTGYEAYTISEPDKAVESGRMTITGSTYDKRSDGGSSYITDYFSGGTLVLNLIESPYALGFGSQVKAGSSLGIQIPIPLSEIAAAHYAQATWDGSTKRNWILNFETFEIDMPAAMTAFIQAMTGNTLYIVPFISIPTVPYVISKYSGGDCGIGPYTPCLGPKIDLTIDSLELVYG